MSETQPTPWQLSADEVLAVVMRDAAEYRRARFELALMVADFPPGPWQDVFRAVDSLYFEEQPIHITAIMDRCPTASLEWVTARWALFNGAALTGPTLDSNVSILKARSRAFAQLNAMSAAIADLRKADSDDDRAAVIGRVITQLSSEFTDTFADATALGAGERFEAYMQGEPEPVITTGLRWLDNNTGGLQRGQNWWIASAYKMRKSTLMRNMALAAARSGAQVTIAAREGSQQLLNAQFVAMLAVEYLIKQGHYNERDAHGIPLNAISATLLLRLKRRFRTQLDPRQVAAVDYGIQEFKRLGKRLRIYDSTPENGALSDLASVQTVVLRDREMYGLDVLFVDYLQLLDGNRSSIYENVSHAAQQLQHMAQRHNMAAVVLAQLNEEAVRGNNNSHSPGVKGGGDPAAAADFLFQTGYPMDAEGNAMKDMLRVQIKLARHGAYGQAESFPMHEASGLLMVGAAQPAPAPPDLGGAR